ncbi:DUF922 domain-containing Zn-dependent protease [Arenicella sp.]|nr:DUF922 domain-containing Zn-dependent protease [Arenicella sp.]
MSSIYVSFQRFGLLLVALFPLTMLAEIIEQTDYYPIVASNAEDLDVQLSLHNRNGFNADTRWTIQPRYGFIKGSDGCDIAKSNIKLTITYSMPEWTNKQDASTELQERWNIWYANLLGHEKNHGYNGRQAYNEIKQGLYLIQPASSCSQLTHAIKTMIERTLFKYSQEDKFYDQRTRHGASEGASIQFSANQ